MDAREYSDFKERHKGSIITTIEQQSGGDYRLGLVTYEAVDNGDVPTATGSVTTVGGADRLIDSNANFPGSIVGDPARGLNPFDGSNINSKISSTELEMVASGLFNAVGLPYAGPEVTNGGAGQNIQFRVIIIIYLLHKNTLIRIHHIVNMLRALKSFLMETRIPLTGI